VKNFKARLMLVVTCGCCLAAAGCGGEYTFSRTKLLMGTTVEIKVLSANETQAEKAIEAAFTEISHVDNIASIFKNESEVSRLNRQGFSSDPELFEIIDRALYVSKLTGGAFDITVIPLIKLWAIKTDKPRVPAEEEINRTLKMIGYQRIKLDYKIKKVYLNKVEVDLGGIAKGFAVDKAIMVLKRYGVQKGLVNAGGDIRFIGDKTWSIGLAHPRLKDKLVKEIKLKNKAIVTSGDYERYFIQRDKRYHHIINPATGYPATECASVTIISDDAATADALATGVFVLGPRKGLALIERLKDTEGIIIDTQGNIYTSAGIQK